MCSSNFKEINAMKMNRLSTAVFSLAFIIFSSQAVAQDQDYKIYELFYNDLEQAESLAKNNDSFAQLILAIAYEFGDGVKVDIKKASDLYIKSAENGNHLAQWQLAQLYFDGGLLPVNLEKGIYWTKQAADNNMNGAIYKLSRLAAHGERGYYPDKNLAYKLCVKAHRLFKYAHCSLKSDLEKKAIEDASWAATIVAKGFGYSDMDLKGDADDFFRLYWDSLKDGNVLIENLLKSAQKGSGRAMTALGHIYKGLGDYKIAMDWFLKGAKSGDPYAMRVLGSIYSKEKAGFIDVSKNLKEAKKYQFLADLTEFPGSHLPLYLLYFKFKPEFNKNYEINLIKKAAQEGNLIPAFEESSSLGLTDIEKVSFMEKAANQGYVPAIEKLVGTYLRGRYVPQNYTKAYMWSLLWKMAKPESPEKMKKVIDQIKEKMDNASINEAQRKAAAWLEGHPNFIE